MRDRHASTSARAVALARAHLHRLGAIDDPWAHRWLTPGRRASRLVARAVRLRWHLAGEPTHHWATSATIGALHTRTGWTPDAPIDGPTLAATHLPAHSPLATTAINPNMLTLTAIRRRRVPAWPPP